MYESLSPDKYTTIMDLKPLLNVESITIEPRSNNVETYDDISGDYRFVEVLSKGGTISIEITNYSASHEDMMIAYRKRLPVVISFVDKSSKAAAFATEGAMLEKMPALNRQKEEGTTTYVFTYGKGEINHSGAKEL